MRKRIRTGAILSLFFTPALNGMRVSVFPMMSLTTLSLYIHLFEDCSLGGQPYRPKISIITQWLEVSKALTRSSNNTNVGKLWLFRKCNSVLSVNNPSGHPTLGVDLNWYFTPCVWMILNNLLHNILLNILLHTYISVTPLWFFGLLRSLLLGTGTTCPSCHSSNSTSPSQ